MIGRDIKKVLIQKSIGKTKCEGGDKMSVYETPKSEGVEQKKRVDLGCGVNCDWGFGAGMAIAMIGPLPGPT